MFVYLLHFYQLSSSTMRGKTVPVINSRLYQCASSYVQVNIYDTNIRELRERGVNIKHILQHIGCRAVVMDVPVFKTVPRKISSECSLNIRRTKSLGCQKKDSYSSVGDRLDWPLTMFTPSVKDGALVHFEDEAVCYDKLGELHPGGRPENEMQIKSRQNLSDSALYSSVMPKLNYADRYDSAYENVPAERRVKSRSLTLESVAGVGARSSTEAFPFPTMRSVFEKNDLLGPNINLSGNSEHSHSISSISESENLQFLSVAESTEDHAMDEVDVTLEGDDATQSDWTAVEGGSVENENQGCFFRAGEIHEEIQVCGNSAGEIHEEIQVCGNSLSTPGGPKEAELSGSHAKFPNSVGSASSVTTRTEQGCVHALQKPASRSIYKMFGECEKRVVEDEKRDVSKNVSHAYKRRMLSPPEFYECKIEGCNQRMRLRYGYGKQRLLEHVRTHWRKLMKKCKLCTFRASHAYKVHNHHKCNHSDSDYSQAESLETAEDMNELFQMWKRCFDAEPPRCLRFGTLTTEKLILS